MGKRSSLARSLPGFTVRTGYGVVAVTDGFDGAPDAMKPNVVEAWAAEAPLQVALRTVAAESSVLSVPFQTWRLDPRNTFNTVD